jgi:hypothetical protein
VNGGVSFGQRGVLVGPSRLSHGMQVRRHRTSLVLLQMRQPDAGDSGELQEGRPQVMHIPGTRRPRRGFANRISVLLNGGPSGGDAPVGDGGSADAAVCVPARSESLRSAESCLAGRERECLGCVKMSRR